MVKQSELSEPIALRLEVLHYLSIVLNNKKFEGNKELFITKEFENIKLNIQKNNLELSLVDRITKYVQKSKSELLIMLTETQKGFFESIFLSSKSAELTYFTKVPILVFSQ